MKVLPTRETTKRIVDIITFNNLPIHKKFIVFAAGVLFWFLVLFTVSITTLVVIRSKANTIVHHLIPQDRTVQKMVRSLKDLSADATEISRATSDVALSRRIGTARGHMGELRVLLTVLQEGDLAGDAEDEQYVRSLQAQMEVVVRKFDDYVNARATGWNSEAPELRELNRQVGEMIRQADAFSQLITKAYAQNSSDIGFDFACTFVTVIIVMVIATVLLAVFTTWISRSIVRPVTSITEQIRQLGESPVAGAKRIEITSRDEIGTLSSEFNGLMESISAITSFKKLIEEDDSIEDVYLRLAQVFRNDIGLDEFSLYEVANSQNKMRLVYPINLPSTRMYCNADILDDCSLCRAKKTGHEISSFAFPEMCRSFLTEFDREYICIPMMMGGVTGGVAQFLFERQDAAPERRREVERKIFKATQYIAESVSVLDAKRLMSTLRESALKDSLTGLYNRRFLQEYTESLVAGILRREKHVGLIMCDLDYFKQVNDVYGHTTGDAVLKETSEIIRDSVRTSDLVIRFGGEEFLVVLMDIKEGESLRIAEKIRANIEQTKIKVPDGVMKKTISLGVSEFPGDTDGFWQAIKFADVALYKAKDGGRNRAVRFTKDMWQGDQF